MNDNQFPNTFPCPSCGQQIRSNPKFIGLPVECPHCQSVVTTPRPELQSSDPTPPIAPAPLTPKPPPPGVIAVTDRHKKRNAIIAGIVLVILLLLLIIALFLRSGAGGGARGQRGPGVNEGSGAATGSEPDRTQPYDAGKGNQSAGTQVTGGETVSDSNAQPKTMLFERTSPFDGIPGSAGNIGGGGTSFFGLSAEGGSFVYIVDCSGSMKGNKLTIAKKSLFSSIAQLNEKQTFFVFFYDNVSQPMPGGKLIAATSENKDTCKKWVNKIRASGGTMPEASLLTAIAMKPEIIFFMSDGEFNIEVCERVKAAQGEAPITIHTIGFVNRNAQKVLKPLAEQNGGIYHFVPMPKKRP